MESIFHEKQEGQLCAQHALNALLQGPYFTAVDLATIASQLDERERQSLAEGGQDSQDYREFMSAKSHNMDDSGFFSIQVMAEALKVWSLDMIPYNSRNSVSDAARSDPTTAVAFICNFNEHWFTIRKIGGQWFNLNSLLTGPQPISDTYLSLFLTQLQTEGYSIFVICGILPACDADDVLSRVRVPITGAPKVPPLKIKLDDEAKKTLQDLKSGKETEDPDLQIAIDESIQAIEERDEALRRTIAASLSTQEREEQRQLEAAIALSLGQKTPPSTHLPTTSQQVQPSTQRLNSTELTEEEMLREAIRLSMESS